jgi:hypothetical protein
VKGKVSGREVRGGRAVQGGRAASAARSAHKEVAPQLNALLRLRSLHTAGGGVIGLRAARAELDALLAVARLAPQLAQHDRGKCTCSAVADAMDRALARLARARTEGGRP